MAKKSTDAAERPGRIKQLRMIAQIIKQANPKGMPIVYASGIGALIVCVVIGLVTGWVLYMTFIGLMLALTVGLVVFGQLAQRAQHSILHGQPGAAAADAITKQRPDLVFLDVQMPGLDGFEVR